MADKNKEAEIDQRIRQLLIDCGEEPNTFEATLVGQIIATGLKLLSEKHDSGQLKVITRSIKEMRYAYRIFNCYKQGPCVSIFGSARTPENHPDYLATKDFSAAMAAHGWMCITGGTTGIMKAGTEGHQKESFGLSMRLPLEFPTTAGAEDTVVEGDPKLIVFRYFFTRKLMFMSHSHAMAAFPGGYGTLDELFEMLTLIQTGKANIIPIVLVEGANGTYWKAWETYINDNLMSNHFISPEDSGLYFLASNPEEAVQHILKFYSHYHSSRYVKDLLVMRLKEPLSPSRLFHLNEKYKSLIASGTIYTTPALAEEDDHLELPRIAFHFTKKNFGLLRRLIDEINEF